MFGLQNIDFITGAAISVILACALYASPWFRNIALALAAAGVIYLYTQDGIVGLLALTKSVRRDLLANPDLAKGLIGGVAIAVVICLGPRLRRP